MLLRSDAYRRACGLTVLAAGTTRRMEVKNSGRSTRSLPSPSVRRSALSGGLLGLGVAGFLDETVFHQLLHWHHFYDRSTSAAGLVSDGLFHAASWLATVVGLFLFADLRRRSAALGQVLWGAGLLGWGVFQLYDGIVQHKLLGLHQIRYGVSLLAYDLTWNVAGGIAAIAGALVLTRARRSRPERPAGVGPTPAA